MGNVNIRIELLQPSGHSDYPMRKNPWQRSTIKGIHPDRDSLHELAADRPYGLYSSVWIPMCFSPDLGIPI
jgi:hypothetical protein